jgi:hypothetical protein
MYSDLGYFVFDVMDDVVEFQEYGDLNDPVVLLF